MYQHQNNILENDEVLFERENEIEEKLQSLIANISYQTIYPYVSNHEFRNFPSR